MSKTRLASLESIRQTRRAVFLVAALYVAIGLVLAVLSALRGDPLGTFLGFLIVSGALGASVVLAAVLRMSAQAESLGEQLQMVSRRMVHLEEYMTSRLPNGGTPPGGAGAVKNLDLSEIGAGDPSVLAAATLDRSVYPRLVRTMDEEPPGGLSDQNEVAKPGTHSDRQDPAAKSSAGADASIGGAATKNLLALWRRAVREGDLGSCRSVYSALVDTAAADELAPLHQQLERIADVAERELRDRFTRCIREKDFASALATGEEICRVLADRPVAQEFQRLRPMLIDRARTDTGHPPPRSAAR